MYYHVHQVEQFRLKLIKLNTCFQLALNIHERMCIFLIKLTFRYCLLLVCSCELNLRVTLISWIRSWSSLTILKSRFKYPCNRRNTIDFWILVLLIIILSNLVFDYLHSFSKLYLILFIFYCIFIYKYNKMVCTLKIFAQTSYGRS